MLSSKKISNVWHFFFGFDKGSESSTRFTVPSSDYLDHLTDQALLNVTALALVEETNQSWVGKKTAPLHKPSIPIMITKANTKKGWTIKTPVPKKCMQAGQGTGSYSTHDGQLSGYSIIYTLPA